MKIQEIFISIQGESTYAGYPCTFVRLAGCTMRCGYCDTKYAQTTENAKEMSIVDVAKEVEKCGLEIVEITGGEPLIQAGEVKKLCEQLFESGYKVLIETNGGYCYNNLENVHRIVDIKTPGSGSDYNKEIFTWDPPEEVKFVVTGVDDFEWACQLYEKHVEWFSSVGHINVSPTGGLKEVSQYAEELLERKKYPFKVTFQLHKEIGLR